MYFNSLRGCLIIYRIRDFFILVIIFDSLEITQICWYNKWANLLRILEFEEASLKCRLNNLLGING